MLSTAVRRSATSVARVFLIVWLVGSVFVTPTFPVAPSSPASVSAATEAAATAPGDSEGPVIAQASATEPGIPTEVVNQRTAYTTLYQSGTDEYSAVISPEPRNYLDQDGNWAPIDATWRVLQDSYVVDHNLIRSRAGSRRAWISVAVDGTALLWQATALGVADAQGAFTSLATALDALPASAEQGASGTTLRYPGGWTSPALSEAIVSTPDSVEHALILAEPPRTEVTAGYLEMQASLSLVPGTVLYADGKPVSGAVSAAETLEVRDASGQPGLVLAPVEAFEEGQPDVAVSGSYHVQPTDDATTYQVSVRTPLAWWLDPLRAYPVVLDPVITVKRTTGYGEGVAWVRSTGDKAYVVGEVRLGAHLPDYNTQSHGYVQFNSLPALLSNAPVQVTAAYLDVEPTDLFIPKYSYSGNGFTDWDSVALKRKATLAYAGACPNDPGCNGFSMQDDRLTNAANYNWDNQPSAADIGTKTLVVGPIKASGNANPTVTTWDVTAQLQSWYASWSDQQNPRPGPVFQLRMVDNSGNEVICPKPGPYISGFVNGKPQFDSQLVPQCTHFYIPPGKVTLRIEYTQLPLGIGQNLLNYPGVPSYAPLSGSTDNLFDTPNHQYALAQPTGPAHWRAVALRGNHAYTESLPTIANLKLLDYTNVVNPDDEPVQLLNPKIQGADKTTFFLIDDHLAGSTLDTSDLRVEVVASSDNDYTQDQQRNYRVQYVQSELMQVLTYGTPNAVNFSGFSDTLIKLSEFPLTKGDSVGITATVPVSLEMMLLTPATEPGNAGALISAGHSNVNVFPAAQPGSEVHTFSFSAPVTGQYAIVLVNKERPVLNPDRNLPEPWSVQAKILLCPDGSYPTAKYGCQPLILPDGLTPAPKSVPIPGGGTLSVYSEGDFTPGAGGDWCTTNEAAGTPIIGPSVSGRWVAVVQGSVCYTGGVLTTSPDSAIALVTATPALSPGDGRQHAQIRPIPIYGDSMLLPTAGQPDGEVTLVSGGILQPQADTIRRIMPFEQYWGSNYTHLTDSVSTADMQAHGSETVAASVTVDAAGSSYPINWSVAWSLYPYLCPSCPVEWTFIDDPAEPSAAFPLELDLASTTLRMVNSDVLDGKVRTLDSYQKVSGPVAFQFHNTTARLTLGPLLGGTTKPVEVVIQPPEWPRAAEGAGSCESGGSPSSCLDLRSDDYAWAPLGDAEQNVLPWSLPDMHIETVPATVMFSRAGQLNIFSTDHPAGATDFAQTFSFDTWEAGVRVTQEKCVASDPAETTVIRGNGFIGLPTLGDDGSGPEGTWIKVAFRLCETSLQEAHMEFGIPKPGIPVGSTGVGVHLLDGTVVIDPNTGETRITLGVGFETLDGFTLTDGKGTVTLDTAGLLSLQATGKLVGVVSADELRLDVAWNPLDVLFKGQVSYGGGLVIGNVGMHGWIGQGWQAKYAWLPANDDFHFTGSIAATVRIKSGSVVDDWPFVLPPFTVSLTAEVAFGEFCTSSSCTGYDWGMSAVVEVLGYDVGVYVDSGGPDLILGSNSHKLIDQAGAAVALLHVAATDALQPVFYPGTNQINLTPPYSSPFDGATPDQAATACTGTGTTTVMCPFTIGPGVGRALFLVSWENGDLDVSLSSLTIRSLRPQTP